MAWGDVKDWRLAKWALPTEWIPLKCEKCGAQWLTINKGPMGKYPIHQGNTLEKRALAASCERAGHTLLTIVPDKKAYLRGDFL
jgi:hypothetical protein